MMIRNILAFFFLFVFMFLNPGFSQKSLDNAFYCFNNGVRTLKNGPETYNDQAALIKKIGFDGLSGHNSVDNFKLRISLDKVGLEMPDVYYSMTLSDKGKINYDEQLKEIIKSSKDRDLLVVLTLGIDGYKGNKKNCDKLFTDGIVTLADFASDYDVKIAIYPHVNNYCEWLDHAVSISEKVNRKNAGVVLNLCHLFKIEGDEDWEEKALKVLPHLFMVSINGSDIGDTENMGWEKLIQPLGEGDFDTYQLVKLLKDKGYRGKFGLQCYNINQDCETALTKSMRTWRLYQKKYQNEIQ